MSDRRYSTARWRKIRRIVLHRDDYTCQIQGPRCTGFATTAHHIHATSQYPQLFWSEENVVASCGPCNYGGGAQVGADNRRDRVAYLERVLIEQSAEIERLNEQLAAYEQPPASTITRKRPNPAIY